MTRIIGWLLVLLLATSLPGLAQTPDNAGHLLSGNEIDLLVGAPTGVAEPLDTRRTRVDESVNHDLSNLLEDDFASESGFVGLDWSDAEDASPDPGQTESQLLDLLAETGEIEELGEIEIGEDAKSEDVISTDYIETEFKL